MEMYIKKGKDIGIWLIWKVSLLGVFLSFYLHYLSSGSISSNSMDTKDAMPKEEKQFSAGDDRLEKIAKEGFDLIEKLLSGERTDTRSTIPKNKLDPKGKQLSDLEDPKKQTLTQFAVGKPEMDSAIMKEKLDALNRKKDLVWLILSYPLKNVDKARHKRWIQDIWRINQKVGDVETLKDRVSKQHASEIYSQLNRLLEHSIVDIEAYVPHELFEKMWRRNPEAETTPTVHKEILDMAVGFATDQIFENMKNPNIRRIGISGRARERVMSELNRRQETRKMFNVVIYLDASMYSSFTDIEDGIALKVGMSASTAPEFPDFMKSLNFLILLKGVKQTIELNNLGTNWWNLNKLQAIVSTTTFQQVYWRMAIDLEVRVEDHLLSWDLFCINVGTVLHSSCLQQQVVVDVVKACWRHLLAIVLMARALKEVEDVHVWKDASTTLVQQTPPQVEDKVLFNALAFVLKRSVFKQKFVEYCAFSMEKEGIDKVGLIQRWIADTLIGTADEGEKMVGDLVNAFLLESLQNGDFVRMRDEIRDLLLKIFGSEQPDFLSLGGRELTKPPRDEAWKAAKRIDLGNNELSELPEKPICPHLKDLSLQTNPYLRKIPPSFFEHMSALQILNLSYTRISTLPPSLFQLGQLQDFVLRGCELVMQLPPEVGELKNLEVLDLEGTEILKLPWEVGNLTKLKSLAVSFYVDDQYDGNGESNTMVPQNVISNLVQLEELSMDVNPDDQRWDAAVKHIVEEVCGLERLKALKLYLPEVALLEEFNKRGTSSSTYLSLLQFRFIVGSHLKRIISRSPHESASKFEQQGRHLKYVNGENVPDNFKKALQHATALFVDRHSTVTSLSEFGTENMKKLEFCMLGECNEIQTVIDGAEISNPASKEDADEGNILESLSYLCIYSMKSIRSIQEGSIPRIYLSNLKSLALHTCLQLKTLFNYALLQNLNTLEELVVEDCPEIVSLVGENVPFPDSKWYLPSLKRISLHYMPKLVRISRGFKIAPKLEWMTFYGCWNLETFPFDEVSVTDLKVIIGDADWWCALKLNTSKHGLGWPHNLDSIFVPIDRNRDLTTQIAEIVTQHKAMKQDSRPPQQPVDARTISKGKQLYPSAPSPPLSPDSHTDDTIKRMDDVLCSMEEMPESLHNVVEDVVSFLEHKQTRRVGIWGMMGTGKTTIMQNLNNHKDIDKMFDIVIWVTVSKEWSIKKLQDAILHQLEMIVQSNVGVKETAWRISEKLRGKKYLILLDEVSEFVDLHKIMQIQDNQESKVVLASRFCDICKAMEANELIKVKPLSDHEAFSLFKEKVGQPIHFPRIHELAELVIKECGGLPLVIDKAAREFKKKGKNVFLWRDGLKYLQRWEAECIHEVISFMKSCYNKVDDDKKEAFLYCVLFPEEYDVYIDYLLECWRAEGFIRSRDHGHQILNALINLSLLERSEKRAYCVKLSKMVRDLAIKIASQITRSRFLLKPCHGLKEPPANREWEHANYISLIDNHLISLPQNLDSGDLLTLFLQGNKELLSIPKFFFTSMHYLRVLDLHGTGISSLPSSVSDLISLKALYLNSCINLKELPSSIKGLHYLEVLDIRGTKLNLFHMKVLLWLKCLRISVFNLCTQSTTRRELDSISALVSLEEFCVDDDCLKQGWDEVVEIVILEVAALQSLTSFQFYFPTVDTLKLFVTTSQAWETASPFTFQFSVGLQGLTISQVPEYLNAPSYNHLKLANTNAVNFVIMELLMRTHVFALINDRRILTVSDFGVKNLDTLLACTVEGCKEIVTIINVDGDKRGALQCLEYLCIYNLIKLESIWKGPVLARSLYQLKILILTKCPKLKKIFSSGMIQQLHHLQQLTVQECHEIEEIITKSENHGLDPGSLPRLKSLVLLDLPQLRSIWVDDSLEWPSLRNIRIFRCSKLTCLPFGHANAARLRSIEGEESWWETLVWEDDAIKERLQSICTRSVSL